MVLTILSNLGSKFRKFQKLPSFRDKKIMEFTSSYNVIILSPMVYSLVLRPMVVIFGALYRRTPYFWIQTIEKRVLIFTVLDKITIRNLKMPLQLKPKKCGSKTRRYVFRMDYLDPVYRVSSHSIRKSGLCSGCNGVLTTLLIIVMFMGG